MVDFLNPSHIVNEIMNQKTLLSRLQNADVIYKKYHIPQAFLVGSFARGEGTSTSDVDIYIP
jgi:predicted nucleotidyltransferase